MGRWFNFYIIKFYELIIYKLDEFNGNGIFKDKNGDVYDGEFEECNIINIFKEII